MRSEPLSRRVARTGLIALMAFGLCGLAGAQPTFQKRADALGGIWFATEVGDRKPRVLRITNVKSSDEKGARFVGYYGFANGTWGEARDLAAFPAGEALRLEFTSGAGSKVSLLSQGDSTLAGGLVTDKGRPIPLRFARSSLPEVHKWIAENPDPGVRAKRNSSIDLVYLSAIDCPSCRSWESEYLSGGKLRNTGEWPHVRFTESKRHSFKAKLEQEQLQPTLQPVFKELAKRGSSIFYGTPSFVLIVDGAVRVTSFGPANFETLVFPALKAAVREKLADTGT